MFCPRCGQEIRDGSAACQYCGTQFGVVEDRGTLEPAKALTADSHYDLSERYRASAPEVRQPEPSYQVPQPPVQYTQPAPPQPQVPPVVYYQAPTPPPTVYVVNNTPVRQMSPQRPVMSEAQRMENYSATARGRGIVALVFSTLGWLSLLLLYLIDPYYRSGTYAFLVVQTVVGFILMIPGMILGFVGLSSSLRYRARTGRHNGNSIGGLVCSILALLFVAVTVVMAFSGDFFSYFREW